MGGFLEALIELFLHSSLFYPILGMFVIGDCVFPLLPSETIVNIAAAWSGSTGRPWVWGIFLASWAYSIIGDNTTYLVGRFYAGKYHLKPNSKRARASDWVRNSVERNEAVTIITARFIPWARWFLTIFLGSVKYPWWRFFVVDTVGSFIWATQATLIGYLGGWIFQEYPLIGVIIGVTAGLMSGVIIQHIQKSRVAQA